MLEMSKQVVNNIQDAIGVFMASINSGVEPACNNFFKTLVPDSDPRSLCSAFGNYEATIKNILGMSNISDGI